MRRLGAIPVLAVLLLAACGSDGDAPAGPGPDPAAVLSPSTSPAPSVTPGPLKGPPPTPSSTPGAPLTSTTPPLDDDLSLPPSGKPARVTGTVTAGVEQGCLLLQDGQTSYQLLGAPPVLLGQVVKVTGRLTPDLATTCQQGTPFTVESYEVVVTTRPVPAPSVT